MLTVTDNFEAEYRIKGSKFLSFINPCDTTKEAELRLGKIRDLHPRATHHCYAFRVGPSDLLEHSQDDGEPSGTAGLPILNTLRSAGLINSILFVVRYYGGTKLGKSGLIDAYGKSAASAIDASDLKKLVPTRQYTIHYSYEQQSLIDKLQHTFNLITIDTIYTDTVKWTVECQQSASQTFSNQLERHRHVMIDIEEGPASYKVLHSS